VFLSGQAPRWQPLHKLGLAFVFAAAAFATAAVEARDMPSVSATVALAQLPPEARETEQMVHRGGPFPYSKDGSAFGNRERALPARPRGFYREYTVKTPGSRDRGARRIVCGGREPKAPEACFYSDDHYTSFRRIVQ
jgi:ribonuclease T1